jgi:hypothetical protein
MRLLGEIYLATDPVDQARAEESLNRALELADSLRMRPLAAHCREGLARSYTKRGQLLRAEEARSKASEIWTSLGG